MAYCTQADLEAVDPEEFLQLADRDGNAAADPTIVAAALAAHVGPIEAACRRRYQVPLVSEPLLTAIAVNLSWYELCKTHPTEAAAKNRDDAMRMLMDIANGKLDLSNQVVPTVTSGGAMFSSDSQIAAGGGLGAW